MAEEQWICPRCEDWYGDPLYHGSEGHAPPSLCFDCWAEEWGAMAALMGMEYATGKPHNWQKKDLALILLCQGFTREEASRKAGIHRRTLYRYIVAIRQRRISLPREFWDWHEGRKCEK